MQGNSILRFIYKFVVAAFALFAFSVIYKHFVSSEKGPNIVVSDTVDLPKGLLEYERNTISVFQNASPSVVFVHNVQQRRTFSRST